MRTVVAGTAAAGLAFVLVLGLGAGAATEPVPAPAHVPAPTQAPAAPQPTTPAPDGRALEQMVSYTWPLRPQPQVVREFEPPSSDWAPGHRGVDLGAVGGSPVYAAAEGVVAFAGRVVDRSVVSIDHADGIRTTYEPLDPLVRAGDPVSAGTVIGHLTGTDTGPHCPATDCLHWGARTGPQEYLDPLLLLRAEPVVIRLYPFVP